MSKKSLLLIVTLVITTLALSACSSQTSTPTTPAIDTTSKPATEKVGDTTKTGTVTKVGEKFYLAAPGGQPEEIDSYALDLEQYLGQELTVTGQYSGDTLFVGKIE